MSQTFSCPACGHPSTRTVDSRRSEAPVPNVRRRRRCVSCHQKFTTREVVQDLDLSGFIDVAILPAAQRQAIRNLVAALIPADAAATNRSRETI